MKLWAISDPHLGFGAGKAMDVFGRRWDGHPEEMARLWRAQVGPEDCVILPGDISWAINFAELEEDLRFLDALPGRKLLGRGNHDYWWATLKKNRAFCAEKGFASLDFIRNNAFLLPPASGSAYFSAGCVVCGTRGWLHPKHGDWKAGDEKYLSRETERLRLSLASALALRGAGEGLVAALHYPPFGPAGEGGPLTELLEACGVRLCVYGHVHGPRGRAQRRRSLNGVLYLNSACDVLDFSPLDLAAALEAGEEGAEA